ncbi:hypothetical protein LINPERPRIM_LOCUS4204 [Linum perenne]
MLASLSNSLSFPPAIGKSPSTIFYHEANFAADCLANLGHGLELGFHVYDVPNVALQYWLRFNFYGCYTSHLISNNT